MQILRPKIINKRKSDFLNALDILKISVNALNEKKGLELTAIKVSDLTVIADYFVLATATSNTHVRALADEVEFKLSEAGVVPNHIEGRATDWILLDYGDIIIHVFGRKSREFYSLDRMWNDGESIDITPYLDSVQEEK